MFSSLPEPEREFRFHPNRKWRVDFAWPASMLAVEIEGMAYGGGRHQRREGFTRDAEKYRALVAAGWRLLRFTSDELKQRPIQCVEETAKFIMEQA
jgi:very-short-patch-repair endonuclease